jgi:hypothetical protein
MTGGRPGRHDDDHLPEQFLVDGVAPPVIGGGPPESPFDVLPDPEPEPEPRGRHRAPQPRRVEPPTAPIPAVHALPAEPERQKRKSWFAWMFRGPGAGY